MKVDLVHVKAIVDPNAITRHFSSVMHLHLVNTRGVKGHLTPGGTGAPAGAGAGAGGAGSYMGVAQAAQFSMGGGFASTSQQVGGGGDSDTVSSILREKAQMVDQGVGVSVDEIWAEAQGAGIASRGKLQDILGALCVTGSAYTCSDENHYLPT
jgi:DNA-binding IclR family transcriptional regulator